MSSQLGATPPDVHVKCINCDLTEVHLRRVETRYAYTFTRALIGDLKEVFGPQKAQGLFVAELGSLNLTTPIDVAFKTRAATTSHGLHTTPPEHGDFAFLDEATNLQQYLEGACREAAHQHLQVII